MQAHIHTRTRVLRHTMAICRAHLALDRISMRLCLLTWTHLHMSCTLGLARGKSIEPANKSRRLLPSCRIALDNRTHADAVLPPHKTSTLLLNVWIVCLSIAPMSPPLRVLAVESNVLISAHDNNIHQLPSKNFPSISACVCHSFARIFLVGSFC